LLFPAAIVFLLVYYRSRFLDMQRQGFSSAVNRDTCSRPPHRM